MAVSAASVGRDVIVVLLGLFAVSYGTNVSTPFLVLYRERLGLSPSQTMAIFVVYVAGIFATLFVAGPISDHVGRRRVVVPFVILSAVASILLLFGRNQFWLLLVGRLLLGMVSGCVLGVGAAWTQELIGKGGEQRAAVLLTVVTYLGFGFGPISSALLAEALPAPLVTPYVIHALATLILVPGLVRTRETVPPREGPLSIRVTFGVPQEHRQTFLFTIVPAAIWVFAFASVSFALLPVLLSGSLEQTGSDVMIAGVAGTLTATSGVLARPLVNRMGARRSLPIGVWLGSFGYLIGTLAYFTESWPLLIPAAVILGTSSGTLTAGCLTRLGEMSDAKTRGASVSTFYLLAYPGMAMPLAVTAVARLTSMDTALLGMSGLGLFAAGTIQFLGARVRS